jgi:hypothetical protein
VLWVHPVIAVADDGEPARDVGHLVDHGGQRPRAMQADGEPEHRERRSQAPLRASCRWQCLGQADLVYSRPAARRAESEATSAPHGGRAHRVDES